MKAWGGEGDFESLVSEDSAIAKQLTAEEIHACFDVNKHLRNVDRVFDRVLKGEN